VTESTDFDDLATALLNDPDRDVSRSGDTLLVRGRVFAALDGDSLVVQVSAARADDLVSRGMASPASGPADAAETAGRWVSVADHEDWPELADEAHVLAEGHVPGGQS